MYLYPCIEFMAHVSPLLSPIAVPFRSAYLAATQSKISPDHDAEFSLLLGPLRAFAIVGLGGEETAVGRNIAFSVSAASSPSPVLSPLHPPPLSHLSPYLQITVDEKKKLSAFHEWNGKRAKGR